jgi:ATP-binding cassette, subfamily B, bacterial IrtB/YbtQ
VPVDGLIAEGFRLRMADDAILRAARVLALPPMPDGPSTPGVVGDIEFESVRFAFDGGKPIFENLAATIPAGKMTAIVGPSGAGKSTLLKLIARFCDVQHGAIRIGGQDIRDIALDDHLRRISLLAQEPFLFNDTVLANLRMANARASDADCMAAARAAHCDFVEQLPSGFNTVLGDNGGGLSGGERLRLTIARALLKGAPIILLDEPTSALDVQSEFYIRQALGTLCRGRTVVVVAHRLSTIREADHLLVMDQGRIVDAGEEADLYQRCALYRDLWHAQAERVRWRLRADSETIRGS